MGFWEADGHIRPNLSEQRVTREQLLAILDQTLETIALSNSNEKEALDWLSSNFPRLFDLYQRSNRGDQNNYFNFNDLFPIAYIAAGAFAEIERMLTKLDRESWEKLREKALPYIVKNSPRRGYHQLFNVLNEARGYVWLTDQGYSEVTFLEDRTGKSPDLLANNCGSTAILEVKCVNQSDDDINQQVIQEHKTIKVEPKLSENFKTRILRSIRDAREQLDAYQLFADRKIVFLVVRLEFSQTTCGESYIELGRFISAQSTNGAEVFHQPTL
ncbi:MAG: hypothetical protein JWM68_4525 [Verrucomicrobiales bacterium]|nr:hypothetical protein [Verrucomicrobiales bacterium]